MYEVFAGDVARLTKTSNSDNLNQAMFLLKIFITLGWSIYPIGYMTMEGNFLASSGLDLDIVYNIGDAINKIGFGLVVYSVAVAETAKSRLNNTIAAK